MLFLFARKCILAIESYFLDKNVLTDTFFSYLHYDIDLTYTISKKGIMKKRISILLLILSVATYSFGQSAQVLEKEIMEYAKKQYPDDKKMQRVTYNLQVESYNYLSTVTDAEILRLVESKYPKDYNMQKLTYDQQVEAKAYMQRALDEESKQLAISQYPSDYHMQKYVYERNLEAKGYNPVVTMPKVEATKAIEPKNQSSGLAATLRKMAEDLYPNDVAMQNKVYAEQVEAYKYLKTVTDIELRNSVLKKYPNDFVTMKTVYDNTVAERASSAANSSTAPTSPTPPQPSITEIIAALKAKVRAEYPDDKDKQRRAYNEQAEAYNYMARVHNMKIKKVVVELYPGDYVTQMEAYDNWIKNLR